MKPPIPFLLLLLLLVGCKENIAAVADADKISYAPAMSKVEAASYESVDSASAAVAIQMPEKETDIEPKIIKNAHLRFETADLEKTYGQVQALIKKYQATITNDSESKDETSLNKDLLIRIPGQHFDAFINDLSSGVPYFDTKEISSQDVTEEYIDVAARIKTKKVLEQRYLELLKKANKVSEMMEVEKQLSIIREEIEAKEGRLQYLKNRVAMSTITLNFYKTTADESGATVSYPGKILNAIKSGFNGISNFFIGLLEMWPFIIILVALIYVIRKRFKKKNKNEAI